jgi:hypothetical protein
MADQSIQVEWAFICDYALIDVGGKLSIMGIFDRLFAATYPAAHPMLFIVTSWIGTPGSIAIIEVRYWSPNQDLIGAVQQQVAFGPEGKSTGVFQMPQLPLPMPGKYVFEFMAGGESMRHVDLTVTTPPEQQP